MSWIEELGKVYELCTTSEIDGEPLAPIAHSFVKAQIDVNVNSDGTIPTNGFAQIVDKNDQRTLIPVTEKSTGGRTSGSAPHALDDELKYVAGDYGKYVADNQKYFNDYLNNLNDWCNSQFSDPAIIAIYKYLSKGTLITDLAEAKIVDINYDTGKLNDKQRKWLVRFRVDGIPTWKSKSLADKFIKYQSSFGGIKQLCYATGKQEVPTYIHPMSILPRKAMARLLCMNENTILLGRFHQYEEMVSISAEFSQKMHSALKWLIRRQGEEHIFDSLCLITWESALKFIPDVIKDSNSLFGDEEPEQYDPQAGNKNQTIFSLTGRENIYKPDSKTMLMMLDSATTGRISMSMYTELATSDYLENLEKWHNSTAWIRKGKPCSFSMKEIANLAFGTEQTDVKCSKEVLKETIQRLVPCAAEGRHIPADIVNSLFIKSCRPSSYENEGNWKNVLNCACGMLRRQIIERKGECSMALDTECRDRSYLYGRLLAVADRAEGSTYDNDSKRTTNARRFFEAFSNHPYTTWAVIMKNLRPYLDRMNEGSRVYYERLINQITDMFDRESFADNSPLLPEFLHAYSCQTNALFTGNKNTDDNKEEN